MLYTTQLLEARESLAPYAMPSRASRGRLWGGPAPPDPRAGPRGRDRRGPPPPGPRRAGHTQVFVYSEGDHYRNRLTHSIEVAQIGRTLARALGCNEDLTEAICLAHDLGHPPFGHAGEETLNQLLHPHGGFDHQRQTYRILTELEERYPEHPGLNLTYEVREGVVKHDTDYDFVDARSYHPEERGTLECQLSNLADEIAYNTSDLDDGLRSGILAPAQVQKLAITQRTLASLGEKSTVDLSDDLQRYRFIRRLVGIEVNDVVQATAQQLEQADIHSLASLRQHPVNVAGYSAEVAVENQALKQFLLQNFYRHYRVMRMTVKAARTLTHLYEAYLSEPRQLPPETQRRAQTPTLGLPRAICDYLAGMTDRYAIQEHRRLYEMAEKA